MLRLTDMHCHILPGVDDGAENMKETLAVLRVAQEQGIDQMIVTPHYHPGRYLVDSQTVLDTLREVREACIEHNITVRLYPGHECYWFSGLIEALDAGEALTMNGTRYVLVEFEPGTVYSVLQSAVRSLSTSGYIPIIAHFERYECLYNRQDRIDELRSSGAFLQMNFDRLLDKDTFFHRNPWRKMLMNGDVDFLGSDNHGMKFRPLHVDEAAEWMEENVDETLLWEILERNISMLIDEQ